MRIALADGTVLDTEDAASVAAFRHSRAELLLGLALLSRRVHENARLAERIRHKYRMKNTTGYGLNALTDFTDPVDILTHLMIGSEGTLGVITELTLKLHPLPEATAAAMVNFPTVKAAVEAATETIQLGLPVARVELADEVTMRGIGERSSLPMAAKPTLFFDLHGTVAGVQEHAAALGEIVRAHGAEGFEWTTDAAESKRLWSARHQAYESTLALRPGSRGMATDVCVPVSRLVDCIEETRVDLDQSGVFAGIVGHVGDGNFHLTIALDPAVPAEVEAVEQLHDRLVHRAIAMEGTCTGEHGVGYGKAHFLHVEHDTETMAMMRRIKDAMDPLGLMNPGKVLSR
jgi:D-lactate dehydrogenase (cytochrome)